LTEEPTFEEMFAGCRESAVHLEMRDAYTPDDPVFLDWKAGKHVDILSEWRDWYDLMVATTGRGVRVRRVRVVSEPITDFIRHEYESTGLLNIPAGEEVRWLPRRVAKGLLLPANDIWVFDKHTVRFGYFGGDGTYLGQELITSHALAEQYLQVFEDVWQLAIDHSSYTPA
jgi:hypothetical protein